MSGGGGREQLGGDSQSRGGTGDLTGRWKKRRISREAYKARTREEGREGGREERRGRKKDGIRKQREIEGNKERRRGQSGFW